ncbi:hypothetical protein [Neorhizobium sp. NCHU2750]|uniref:hypothetical protein n=1 Tax=Neorhizobium sp. NCHU2750 TaxID=1825976 RepID=UPI000E7079F6|nr:hypothetical protein NCHU2750_07250 [Neorhizobium sp. NCHU2750]
MPGHRHLPKFASASLFAFFIASSLVPPASAQDYMEAQRCVWRCNEATGGRQPAYDQCIARSCDIEPEPKQSKKPSVAAPTGPLTGPMSGPMSGKADYSTDLPEGQWAYGTHPVMGRGAFVNIGAGAFGVTCPPPQGRYVSSVRMSQFLKPAGLTDTSVFATAFTGPFQIDSVQTWTVKSKGKVAGYGYYEIFSDICTTRIPELMTSGSYVLFNAEGHGIEQTPDGGYAMTLKTAHGMVAIKSEADMVQIPGNRVIPLSGSTKAIRRLMAECPAFRQQVTEGCEADD